jgi:hypothetical protein
VNLGRSKIETILSIYSGGGSGRGSFDEAVYGGESPETKLAGRKELKVIQREPWAPQNNDIQYDELYYNTYLRL